MNVNFEEACTAFCAKGNDQRQFILGMQDLLSPLDGLLGLLSDRKSQHLVATALECQRQRALATELCLETLADALGHLGEHCLADADDCTSQIYVVEAYVAAIEVRLFRARGEGELLDKLI